MPDTAPLTNDNHKRAGEFVRYLLLHVGPMIDEMQLTRNEAELAFAYLLGESLAHREPELRQILARQWHEITLDAADQFAAHHRGPER
jgi:hypothetical protein